MATDSSNKPPPTPVVLLKGWAHFRTQLSQTLPTELQKANRVRRFATSRLTRRRG